MKTFLYLSPMLAAWLLVTGCNTTQPEKTGVAAQPAEVPPNYDTPETEFVTVTPGQLSPEFLGEQGGKYVTFDGRYMTSNKGAIVGLELGRGATFYSDLMYLMVGSADVMSARNVNVIYTEKDRELGRPFTEWKVNTPIKVYAYVLPANTKAKTKVAANSRFGGFKVPTVILIKAVAKPAA